MWWPWRRYRNHDRVDEALVVAEQRYEEVKQLRADAEQVAEAHRILRQHNHFADAISKALRGTQ